MKRFAYFALPAVAAFCAVAVAANFGRAADLGSRAMSSDVSATSSNFSGVYLSATGGMEFMNTGIGIDGEPVSLSGIGSDGWAGEAVIGYDWQPRGSRFGVGVFAGANVSSSETTLTVGSNDVAYGRDWGWLAGARVFTALTDDTMAYVGGGYTQADFSIDVNGSNLGSKTFDGYFAEIGVETRVTNNVFAKVSGRYTAYDKTGDDLYVEPESLQLLCGLTFKLN